MPFVLGVLLFSPSGAALAQIVITEIMYDLEGADTGREWVEVYNSGGSDVALETWKLFEEGSNHKLSSVKNGVDLASGEYAVIAENSEKFLIDYPDFAGNLFDSSFSLKNTGELLILRDSNLVDIDKVEYSSDRGGAGDGNSLQRSEDKPSFAEVMEDKWIAALPTPGMVNAKDPVQPHAPSTVPPPPPTPIDPTNSAASNVSPPSPAQESSPSNPPASTKKSSAGETEKRITASVSGKTSVLVGAFEIFSGEARGADGKSISQADFLWNFGDGSTARGQRISHIWHHPGQYVIFLSASAGELSATARLTIEALPPKVSIVSVDARADGFIKIANESDKELDLSGWSLVAGDKFFQMPNGSIMLAGATITLAIKQTNLTITDGAVLILKLSTGKEIARYAYKESVLSEGVSSGAAVQTSQVAGTAVDRYNKNEKKVASAASGQPQTAVIKKLSPAGSYQPKKEAEMAVKNPTNTDEETTVGQNKIISKNETEDASALTKDQTASVVAANTEAARNKNSVKWLYLLGLGATLAVASASIFVGKGKTTEEGIALAKTQAAKEWEVEEIR